MAGCPSVVSLGKGSFAVGGLVTDRFMSPSAGVGGDWSEASLDRSEFRLEGLSNS